jgi:Zn-dependent protease
VVQTRHVFHFVVWSGDPARGFNMISLETLTTFLGWCTVINIGILLVFLVAMSVIKKDGFFITLAVKIFGNTQEDALATMFRVFQQYRLLFVMFNLVPYIALKIMA